MNARTDVDELIREIALTHGVAVGRDDPIMILATANRRLIEATQKSQEDLLARYKSELERVAASWGNDAAAKAEKVLTATLQASQNAAQKTLDAAAQQHAEALQAVIRKALEGAEKHTDAALRETSRAVRDARQLIYINLGVAAVTMVAAGFLALAAA